VLNLVDFDVPDALGGPVVRLGIVRHGKPPSLG
jgi:hypothetical protein